MLAKVFTGTTVGLDGTLVEVEVDVAGKGFPTLTIVGLPDKAIDEAKDRVRTAIINAGFDMPDCRITVNLAPADLPKIGTAFDLPIAIGILAAGGMVNKENLFNSLFIGELSLEGKLRKVPGAISIGILCQKQNKPNLFLPFENGIETSLIEKISIFPANHLGEIILHLNNQKPLAPQIGTNLLTMLGQDEFEFDFADIKGQDQAKRAMTIAAAGFHNVHIKGSPGTGKTMLSRAFPSILPPVTKGEILEISKIYSVTGLLNGENFMLKRPFRSPHHTISKIGLIGGGTKPTPGEISLAHRGVLFLDEFYEFPRSVLESLRQPLEDGKVTISRAAGSLTFPSRFILIAASNPCPCGYLGHPKRNCRCLPGTILKYQKRISGPLLDRIDLHVNAYFIGEEKLTDFSRGEKSEVIKSRVMHAYDIQKLRFRNSRIKTNGEMTSAEVKKYCLLSEDSINLLKQAIGRLSLSARSYFKTIKIAQTIADLENSTKIRAGHLAEALQYRDKEN